MLIFYRGCRARAWTIKLYVACPSRWMMARYELAGLLDVPNWVVACCIFSCVLALLWTSTNPFISLYLWSWGNEARIEGGSARTYWDKIKDKGLPLRIPEKLESMGKMCLLGIRGIRMRVQKIAETNGEDRITLGELPSVTYLTHGVSLSKTNIPHLGDFWLLTLVP